MNQEKKCKHMTLDDRIEIQECLSKGMTFKAIGKRIGKDQTTVSKEVKLHGKTYSNSFTKTDESCPGLLKAPFVCNGCPRRNHSNCRYVRRVYQAKAAQQEYETVLAESREGIPLTKEEFYRTEQIVSSAVKAGQNVYHAIQAIIQMEENEPMIVQAYVQIVLARCIGKMELVEKSCVGSDDLIYRTVSYVSGNFRKKFSLEEMAYDLSVSKYVLSRVFSKTFHCNFNQYLNDARLSYACTRLVNSRDTILDICLDSGFDSPRTFNRVFKERYRITPSEYRKLKR